MTLKRVPLTKSEFNMFMSRDISTALFIGIPYQNGYHLAEYILKAI